MEELGRGVVETIREYLQRLWLTYFCFKLGDVLISFLGFLFELVLLVKEIIYSSDCTAQFVICFGLESFFLSVYVKDLLLLSFYNKLKIFVIIF